MWCIMSSALRGRKLGVVVSGSAASEWRMQRFEFRWDIIRFPVCKRLRVLIIADPFMSNNLVSLWTGGSPVLRGKFFRSTVPDSRLMTRRISGMFGRSLTVVTMVCRVRTPSALSVAKPVGPHMNPSRLM